MKYFYGQTVKFKNNAKEYIIKRKILTEEEVAIFIRAQFLYAEKGPVVRGYSPIRKRRLASEKIKEGTRGGFRVIYGYFIVEDSFYLLLLEIYYKKDKEDLSNDEYLMLKDMLINVKQKHEFFIEQKRFAEVKLEPVPTKIKKPVPIE